MKKWILSFIFVVVAIVMIGAALYLPWHVLRFEGEYESETSESYQEWKLKEVHWKDPTFGEDTIAYTDEAYEEDEEFVSIFDNTYYLVIIALIISIIFLVLILVIRGTSGRVLGICLSVGLLAAVIALLAPVYIMVALPSLRTSEWEKDSPYEEPPKYIETFFGSDSRESGGVTIESSWGGGAGWYLTLGASILILFGYFIMLTNLITPEQKKFARKKAKKRVMIGSIVAISVFVACVIIPFFVITAPETGDEKVDEGEIVVKLSYKVWHDIKDKFNSSNPTVTMSDGRNITFKEGDRIKIVDKILEIQYDEEFKETEVWFESIDSRSWNIAGDFHTHGDYTDEFKVGDEVSYVITITELREDGKRLSWTELTHY